MKTYIYTLTLGLCLCLAASLPAQLPHPNTLQYPAPKAFALPKYETFTMKNGIKVYLVEDSELPLIDLELYVRTGGVMDPADKVGLASMLGTVMRTGGCARHTADALNRLLENKAASIETSIGGTVGQASMNVLKEDFELLLPTFIDLVLNPTLPQDKLDLAKKQARSAIARRNDDAGGIAQREFAQLIYGKASPYARNTELPHIEAITRDDLVAFHKKYYVANNMMIRVVGDFKTAQMKEWLTKHFASMPKGAASDLTFPKVNYTYAPSINFINKSNVNQSSIRLGHIGGRRQSPDYAALQLMNEVLSGGFSGRLMQEVRTNQGLAYGVSGGYGSNALYDGVFFITVGTKSSTTAQALDAILVQIKRLQNEPITEKELQEAKDRILSGLVFRYESRVSVVDEQVNYAYVGLPTDAFQQYVEQLKKLTVADVQRVAKQYLRPDAMQVLVVGNEKEIGNQLDKYGKVNKIDINPPKPAASPDKTGAVKGDAAKGKAMLAQMAAAIIQPGVQLKTLRLVNEGTQYNERMPGGKMAVQTTQTIMPPNNMRMEINAMGRSQVIEIKDGSGTIDFGGAQQPLPEQAVQQLTNNMARSHYMVAYNAAKLEAEYMGMEEFEGKKLAKLVVQLATPVTYFVDPGTALPMLARYTDTNMQGEAEQIEERYDKWTAAGGLTLAYSLKRTANGKLAIEALTQSHQVNP